MPTTIPARRDSFRIPSPGRQRVCIAASPGAPGFCFLIDPTAWAEIEGEAFAPGFFIWNSEVGKQLAKPLCGRSACPGAPGFWFQAVCQNHIVWDAVDVVEFSRKHTANPGAPGIRCARSAGLSKAWSRNATPDATASSM